MMKSLPLLAACLLFPVFAFGAGTAKVRIVNEGRDPVTVSGQTVPRGRSAVVEVPAGASGEILGQDYPPLRPGATYALRVKGDGRGAGVPPAVAAPASSPRPAPTTTTTRPRPVATTTTTTQPRPVLPPNPQPEAAPPTQPASEPARPQGGSRADEAVPKVCFIPEPSSLVCPVPASGNEAWPNARALADGSLDGLDATLDYYDIPDERVALFKDLYQTLSPLFGADERAAIMKRLDARHAGRLWVPRRASTIFGSMERVMDAWGTVEDAATVVRIGSIMARGALEGKSAGQIVDDLAESGIGTSNQFGEAAYWTMAIGVGMYNGRSFTEAVMDAFDPETAGTWSKIGWGMGYWAAEGVMKLRKWFAADERKALEDRMVAGLREAGYDERAERALRAWLALDDASRAAAPFALKDEWLTGAADLAGTEAPGPESDAKVLAFVDAVVGIEERLVPGWTHGVGHESRLPRQRAAQAEYRRLDQTDCPEAFREIFHNLVRAQDNFIALLEQGRAQWEVGTRFVDAVSDILTQQILFIRQARKSGFPVGRFAAVWPEATEIQDMDDPALYASSSVTEVPASYEAPRTSVLWVVEQLAAVDARNSAAIVEYTERSQANSGPEDGLRGLAAVYETCCKNLEQVAESAKRLQDAAFVRSLNLYVAKNRDLARLFADLAAAAAGSGADMGRASELMERIEVCDDECAPLRDAILREADRAGADTSALRTVWPDAAARVFRSEF